MDSSTRHLRGIGEFGKGVHCSCGKFVPDDTNHSWSLPSRLEDKMATEGYTPCPFCSYRWEHPELNINCGNCEDGWVVCPSPLKGESDAPL